MSRVYTACELDLPRCSLTYGSSPCAASVGSTDNGLGKCKNTPATCQDPANYSNETETIRWVKNTASAPQANAANLSSVSIDGQRINPGEDLGKRERVTATFENHPHNDAFFDPYIDDRDYNPSLQGTYWGKFTALWPNIQGYEFRVIRTWENDNGSTDTETAHYIADSGSLNGDRTSYTITARDALTLLEGSKALFPQPTNGVLDRPLNDSTDDTFDLDPDVVSQYGASGEYSMGEEYGTYTRSGNTITLTSRGIFGSEITEHDEGDTFQRAGSIVSERINTILNGLLGFTPLPVQYRDTDQYFDETEAVDTRLYTVRVAEPTEIHKLLTEMCKDFAMTIYTDVIGKRVVMKFIRPQSSEFELEDAVFIGSPSVSRENRDRISAAYVRFARKNPLLKMDEPRNYSGRLISFTQDANIAIQNNSPSIRQHFSRFIPGLLRPAAADSAAVMVRRGESARAIASVAVPHQFSPKVHDVGAVTTRLIEDQNGAPTTLQMQVVKVNRGEANNQLELVEFRAAPRLSEGVHQLTLVEDQLNMGVYSSLRQLHNSVYGTGTIPDNTEVIFIADASTVYGSAGPGVFSVIMGDWPELSNGVTLEIRGLRMVGAGGNGGSSPSQINGGNGGPTFYTRVPVTLDNCEVFGGAGGGGGASRQVGGGTAFARGGGAAGFEPGTGFETGGATEGGSGEVVGTQDGPVVGGAGGDLGQPGEDGIEGTTLGNGGSVGTAIDGDSHVTLVNSTVTGPRIN